jgi:predicted ArsR family transcriptional regulator
MAPYPDEAGFKGSASGPGADNARYYSAQVTGRRRQVLGGLDVGPGTAEEIAVRVGLHWYLTRPRLSELKALGLVIETGERGTGALGGSVSRWRLTSSEERAQFAARKAAEGEHEEHANG